MRSIQPPPPRFHGTQTAYVPANLASADYVYVRKDSHRHPLQCPYDGPYRVLNKSDKYFTLDVKGRTETVSIDRLKAAHVTQLATHKDSNPVPCPMDPPSSISRPAATSSLTPSTDNPITTTRSGRIPRRPTLKKKIRKVESQGYLNLISSPRAETLSLVSRTGYKVDITTL
ncbi:hypothetical protein RRG08_050820 [Elysia crispata]|uniref:Uncharacterized protein n=1 Tax=Elysia crispata TaxID=231223 RepID=A0AAE1AE08_9GAST|nr:hypothetical protein RRG08_050820 [Elysia crispata]